MSVTHIELQERAANLRLLLERVRFLLLTKEGELHARRSVLLAIIGLGMGVASLVPLVIALLEAAARRWH